MKFKHMHEPDWQREKEIFIDATEFKKILRKLKPFISRKKEGREWANSISWEFNADADMYTFIACNGHMMAVEAVKAAGCNPEDTKSCKSIITNSVLKDWYASLHTLDAGGKAIISAYYDPPLCPWRSAIPTAEIDTNILLTSKKELQDYVCKALREDPKTPYIQFRAYAYRRLAVSSGPEGTCTGNIDSASISSIGTDEKLNFKVNAKYLRTILRSMHYRKNIKMEITGDCMALYGDNKSFRLVMGLRDKGE